MDQKQTFIHRTFRPLSGSPILLDFSACRYLGDVHAHLRERLGLPAYYGKNRDALWDCLDGFFDQRGNWQVEIRGFWAMPAELQRACLPMLDVFRDLHAAAPNVTFLLIP